MTTLDTQDIDALLAQADSLMDEMASNLGGSDGAAVSTTGETSGPTSADTDAADCDPELQAIADDLTAFTATVDSESVVEPSGDEGGESTDEGSEAEPTAKRSSDASSGASAAPAEWVDEAQMSGDAMSIQGLPTIPDEQGATEEPVAPATLANTARRLPVRLLRGVIHSPIDALVLLDRPFARLGSQVKTCIGFVAIATLLMAAGTWVVGGMYLVK